MSRFVAWLDAHRRSARRRHAAPRGRARCSRCSAPTPAASRRAFPFFLRKRAPVSGVESLLEYQGRLIAEARGERDHRLGRGRRAGQVALPVLEGDLRLRRAQPALARDDPRRAARRAVVARAGSLRRGLGVERDLVVAQARRREVDHRARLREPEVRRGHGARRGPAAERRCAHRPLQVDVENFESIHAHSAMARIER